MAATAASRPPIALRFRGDLAAAGQLAVGNHHVRAALRRHQRHFAADAAGPAHHQHHAPAQFLRGGCRRIFASSSAQYSMRNASEAGSAT